MTDCPSRLIRGWACPKVEYFRLESSRISNAFGLMTPPGLWLDDSPGRPFVTSMRKAVEHPSPRNAEFVIGMQITYMEHAGGFHPSERAESQLVSSLPNLRQIHIALGALERCEGTIDPPSPQHSHLGLRPIDAMLYPRLATLISRARSFAANRWGTKINFREQQSVFLEARLAHEEQRRLVHAAVIVFGERERMTVSFPAPWGWVCLVVDPASNSWRTGPGYDGVLGTSVRFLERDAFATAAMMTKASAWRAETHRVLPATVQTILSQKKTDEERRSHRLPPAEDPVDPSDAAAAPGGYRLIR
ncbi:hypothetical protein CPLU01_12144 [Colletotrichum plurivorum]|uniref:Uncharacterized protein n=1 Tax=Colletotrichum plurivorum TaxID=2175906 RepID=A0A8H6N7G6_9PEZI|nr:hypothetical protein CPLU01_12144 [Colletotrichum plurivorum]